MALYKCLLIALTLMAQFAASAYVDNGFERLETSHDFPVANEAFMEDIGVVASSRQARDLCMKEHNDARRQNGKGALIYDTKLENAAKGHNDIMTSQNCFSHQCRGEKSPGDRVTAAGYTWSMVGENIAAGQGDCKSAMQGWMNSEGHRRNILNNYRNVGCAQKRCSSCDYNIYWTCVFGTPM